MSVWEILITLAGGLAVAVVGALVGALLWHWWIDRRGNQHFRRLLNFDRRRKAVFVFPTRPPTEGRMFEQVATEDMLAINHIDRALTLANWPPDQLAMRSHKLFEERDWEENLILICCPKSNQVAKVAYPALTTRWGLDCKFRPQMPQPHSNPWWRRITRRNRGIERWELVFRGATFRSPAFDQEIALKKAGKNVPEGLLEDYALLAKLSNPWNPRAKMLLVAGIRAIGTWGAAKHLREHAAELDQKFKDRDFATVVRITYSNWRILSTDDTGTSQLLS